MRLNKRGVALLQVLIVAAILAGMSALILRVVLSRTLVARQNRRTVSAQLLIDSCMNGFNQHWASKEPETYAEDLASCCIDRAVGCDPVHNRYRCEVENAFGTGTPYTVEITMSRDEEHHCLVNSYIDNGVNTL